MDDSIAQAPLPEQVVTDDVPESTEVTPLTAETSTEPLSRPSQDWSRIDPLALTWLIGALGVAGLALVSDLRLWLRVRTLRPVTDGKILECFEDCKTEMDVHTIVGLVLTDRVSSPCIFGVVRPRVLLPLGALESLSEKQLRFVFLHELAHLKRWDNLLGWLMLLAQVLHWFNPLVWFAMLRMRTDRELACDHRVLSLLSKQEANAYGATIMDLSTGWARLGTLPSMAGIVENRSLLKRRIEMIAEFKPQTKSHHWLALGLLLVIALVTLTEAQTVRPQTIVDQMPQEVFDHLLLYYSFDKDGGLKAVDISGMDNHGEIRDSVYLAEGRRNGALQFNGESTQIILDDMKLKAYTFATWAKTETENMNNRVLFQLYQGETSYSFQGACTCPVDVYVSYDQSMGTTDNAWGPDEALPVGKWIHWAVTYDGESVVVYRNGRPYPAGSAKVSSFRQGPVYIGGADIWTRDSGGYWLGALDEVALFNQALTAQQVQQLYTMYGGSQESSAQSLKMGSEVNLVVTELVVLPYPEDGLWQVVATIYNDSDVPVEAFDMDFHINDPERKNSKRCGGVIEPQAEFHEATLPFGLEEETVHTIEVVIDPDQEIQETNEGDNCKAIEVTVKDGVIVQSPSASPVSSGSWFYDLDPVVSNLNDPEASRYIRVSFSLEISNRAPLESVRTLLAEKKLVIRDLIGKYLATQSLADLQGQENLDRIPREIKDRLNEILFPGQNSPILNVLYRERAIQ